MIENVAPDRILTFLRRAGHQVDGYMTQLIGQYLGNKNFQLITNCIAKNISEIKVVFEKTRKSKS